MIAVVVNIIKNCDFIFRIVFEVGFNVCRNIGGLKNNRFGGLHLQNVVMLLRLGTYALGNMDFEIGRAHV